jgi:cytochrome P450
MFPLAILDNFSTKQLLFLASNIIVIALFVYRWLSNRQPKSFRNLQGISAFLLLTSGPTSDHWFFGNMSTIIKSPTGLPQTKWLEKYGSTLRFTSFARSPALFTIDPVSISYMWSHTDIFGRYDSARNQTYKMMGPSLTWAVGDDHKRMRRTMNPAFGSPAIKDLVPLFISKSNELVEIMNNGGEIEILETISKCTADIIGLAGFDYDFGAMRDEPNELLDAYNFITESFDDPIFMTFFFFGELPILKHIVS